MSQAMLPEAVLISSAIQQGLLDPERVAKIKLEARRQRQDFLPALALSERFPMAALYRAYAELRQLPFVAGKALQPDPALLRKLPASLVERRLIVPLQRPATSDEVASAGETAIALAVANPEDRAGIEQARRILNQPVAVHLAEPQALQYALQRAQGDSNPFAEARGALVEFDPVQVLDDIFTSAYLHRASDIHFEPLKESFQIRLRVDGRLQDYQRPLLPAEGSALMSRMKVLAGMDISEQRTPQDGSLTHEIDDKIAFDVRAASMPTRFGERATLRLLGSDAEALSLEKIGMSADALGHFRECINKPYGIVLVTGPTGSGKSTTLYSALQEIATDDINVLTVEDPVEYVMEGISQVQVGTKIAFAEALRAFLRHDPDVIMVGEIRDGETASIAMKAAMTGHLVFSTLHTNSALSTINRLVDIGVERYLVGATLLSVIAQRLVRRLCPQCKQPQEVSARERLRLGLASDDSATIYRPQGCASCLGTGYRGRLALFETLWVDDKLAGLIAQGVDEATLRREADSFYSLAEDGRSKVLAGLTSLDEIARLSLTGVPA